MTPSDDYGELSVARTGLVVAFVVPPSVAPDAADIECPPGFCIVPETGEGIPAANEESFGSYAAWRRALEVKP